jgi:hypothetical protein
VTPEERGAKLLDEKYEGDWREKIDVDELDMDNQDECVLGQLYGDYEDGLVKLFGRCDYQAGEDYGFDHHGNVDAWKEIILKKREQVQTPNMENMRYYVFFLEEAIKRCGATNNVEIKTVHLQTAKEFHRLIGVELEKCGSAQNTQNS